MAANKLFYTFLVDTTPVPWQRAGRHNVIGSDGRYKYTRTFDTERNEQTKLMIQWSARQARAPKFGALVNLYLFVRVYLPKAASCKAEFPNRKRDGDWDNYGKLVSDALNGICYEDDGQIIGSFVQKSFALSHDKPHYEVTLLPVSGWQAAQMAHCNFFSCVSTLNVVLFG